MINKGLFTSNSDEWETPQKLFDELDREFHFNLDPCASDENYKCRQYYTREEDGLKMDWVWAKRIFMNPPYGREIGKWIKKAYEESQKGCTIVCLLPARTDTSYFHEYIYPFNINLNGNENIAWATGIIDGEGCIFIRKNKPTSLSRHRSIIHDLGLKVSMCSEETIYKLKNIFDCGHIRKEKRRGKEKDIWHWVCRSKDAEKIVKAIYRYSVTKKHELFEAIKFSLLPTGKRGRKKVSQELLNEREKIYQEIKKLKIEKSNHSYLTTEIRFLRGRLKFKPLNQPAPFPSMIVIFRKTS